MTFWQAIGALMIVSAVLTAVVERKGDGAARRQIIMGVIWGALAMAANAVGIVMIKPLLTRSPLIWVTEWRLIGGVAVLLALLQLLPARRRIVNSIFSRQRWGYTLSGSFLGGYLAMIVWLGGMKFTQASIAAALNQTSNIFIFIFAGLILHERITPNRVLGIIMGVGGSLLVTFC